MPSRAQMEGLDPKSGLMMVEVLRHLDSNFRYFKIFYSKSNVYPFAGAFFAT